uniref:Integrase SAM-like N-terminal domain-containing protein n=1 Tax=Schlesneria paludicola TaxID=360056 RepID=A0A7C4QPM0_9PLAN
MTTYLPHRRVPLGLFPDKSAPRLYDRIVAVPRVRHDSRRTEEAYLHWIRRFILFHDRRHPRQLVESALPLTPLDEHPLNRGGRGVRSPADVLARRPDER